MSDKEFLAEELKALLPPNAVIVSGDEYSKLKKEVEELRKKHSQLENDYAKLYSNYYDMGLRVDKEIPRLRELLGRSKPYFDHEVICDLPHEKQCPCGLDQLLAEIDNALNHKP